jgi:hypothetical protein
VWCVVCGAKGNPYLESPRLSFFLFPSFFFIPRRAPRGRQESHIVCVPRDAAEAAIFLLHFTVAHVTPLCGQGSPYFDKVSWPSSFPSATHSQWEQIKLFAPLQTLQYFPCLGLIVTEQFFPLQGGWALAEEETEDDDDDHEPPPEAPPDAPLTCPLPFTFSRPRFAALVPRRLLLAGVCPPDDDSPVPGPPDDSPAAAASEATRDRTSMSVSAAGAVARTLGVVGVHGAHREGRAGGRGTSTNGGPRHAAKE